MLALPYFLWPMRQLNLCSSLSALDGDGDVCECSYVQSDLTDLPFFASREKLGKRGVEALISSDLQDSNQI